MEEVIAHARTLLDAQAIEGDGKVYMPHFIAFGRYLPECSRKGRPSWPCQQGMKMGAGRLFPVPGLKHASRGRFEQVLACSVSSAASLEPSRAHRHTPAKPR